LDEAPNPTDGALIERDKAAVNPPAVLLTSGLSCWISSRFELLAMAAFDFDVGLDGVPCAAEGTA